MSTRERHETYADAMEPCTNSCSIRHLEGEGSRVDGSVKEEIIGTSRVRASAYGDVKEVSEYRARRSTSGRQSTVTWARGWLIPRTPFRLVPHRWSKR
jgi:hypothetical protein